MATETMPEQLSFLVGGRDPDISIIRVSGGITSTQDLRKEQEVHVVVSTMDGEVVANGYGYVVGVSFKDNYKDGVVDSTDRIQTVKVS